MSIKLTPLIASLRAGSALSGTEKFVGADGTSAATWTGSQFAAYLWASPALTGVPTAPTAAPGTNTTQLATTAFVAALVSLATTGLLDLKGDIDCSANPNYPAASKGDAYFVSVAGKIGGASGISVDVGDTVIAKADNAGGTQAAVGTSWWAQEHNLAGALVAANNLSDVANAATARGNLSAQALSTVLTYLATASTADAAGIKALLGLVIGTDVEAHDPDLTTIAGLTPTNDDIIQRKGGAWANRTMAQLRADLAAAGMPYTLAQDAPAASLTGSTSLTTLATITVPANAMGAKGQIEIDLFFSCTANANTKVLTVYFGGQLFYTSPAVGSTVTGYRTKLVISNKTVNSQIAHNGGATGLGTMTAASITAAVDTTSPVTILIRGQLGSGSDTMVLESYSATLRYSA